MFNSLIIPLGLKGFIINTSYLIVRVINRPVIIGCAINKVNLCHLHQFGRGRDIEITFVTL